MKGYYSFLPDYYEAAFYSKPSMNYQLKTFKSELFELVLNQAKEVALLRVLGVGKTMIQTMQLCQISILTMIGLAVGFILLVALRGVEAVQWSEAVAVLVYLAGALLGTLLGNNLVTGRKPMELLQVKE